MEDSRKEISLLSRQTDGMQKTISRVVNENATLLMDKQQLEKELISQKEKSSDHKVLT